MAGYNLRSRSRKRMKLEVSVPATEAEETVEDSGPMGKALANEYILAELFSYLSVSDLKSSRFVNRVWNQEATGQLIRKAPAVDLKHPSNRGREILELLDTSWNFPCRKFALHANLVGDHNDATPGQKAMLVHFLETVAPFAIHLSVQPESYPLFSRRKPKKTTEYPRLTSLELDLASGHLILSPELESLYTSKNLDAVIPILQHAPRLERVSLAFIMDNDEDVQEPTFCDLLKHVPWNQIRHLKLNGTLKDCNFQTILKLGSKMQLKSFDIVCSCGLISSRPNINELLKHQSPFLEALTLKFLWVFEPIVDFTLLPEFTRLKTLKINVGRFDEDFPFMSLPSFHRWFSVLESLTIEEVPWIQLGRLFNSQQDGFPLETLKELKLDAGTIDALPVIHLVAKMFPRVTKLGLPAHREILEAIEVGKLWKDLAELTLFHNSWDGSTYVDYALTGYSPDQCELSREMHPGSPELQQVEMDAETKILKFYHQLKTLSVEGHWKCIFSDFSCRFVLLKLENLKSLNIFAPEHQISEEMIREMRAKFKVEYYEKEFLW